MAKKKAKPERSEVIEQCVIYVQAIAAFDAGFKADHTGDLEYASHNQSCSLELHEVGSRQIDGSSANLLDSGLY
jgi:hypothetical protein